MCKIINEILSHFDITDFNENEIKKENGDITYIKTFINKSKFYKIEIYDMNGFNNSRYFGMLVLSPIHKIIHNKNNCIRFLFETLE